MAGSLKPRRRPRMSYGANSEGRIVQRSDIDFKREPLKPPAPAQSAIKDPIGFSALPFGNSPTDYRAPLGCAPSASHVEVPTMRERANV
jgi:hypothetical protein